MKFELETSDISAIADMVLSKLSPLLDDLKKTGKEIVRLQNTLPAKASSDNYERKTKIEVVKSAELPQLTGLSRTTIWRLENNGQFPKRRNLSGKRVGWLRAEIDQWRESRQKV